MKPRPNNKEEFSWTPLSWCLATIAGSSFIILVSAFGGYGHAWDAAIEPFLQAILVAALAGQFYLVPRAVLRLRRHPILRSTENLVFLSIVELVLVPVLVLFMGAISWTVDSLSPW